MNFEFLKITAPSVFTRDLKASALPLYQAGTCMSKMGIMFNATGRANEIGQSWCLADLLDFKLPTTGTSQRPPIDPTIATTTQTSLHYCTLRPHWSILYSML